MTPDTELNEAIAAHLGTREPCHCGRSITRCWKSITALRRIVEPRDTVRRSWNQLRSVEYQNKLKIRTLGTRDNPLFVAADVCAALALENVSKALMGLDLDDITESKVVDSAGRRQDVKCVTEAGLYQLIFKSIKPEAKEFKRWVTKEVLPQIL